MGDPTLGMRPHRRGPRGRFATIPLCGIVLLAALVLALPGGAGALPAASGGAAVAAGSTAGTLAPSGFAGRAGYPAVPASAVTDPVPAAGNQEVEITFAPTNLTLYDVPAAGAAPMTTSEIANDYGLSLPAYTAAEEYFEAEGLTIAHAWPDRLSLSLSGPSSAVDRAFATDLLSGTYGGRSVTFPASAPSLPTELEAEIESVAGLADGFDSFSLPLLPAATNASGVPAQGPTQLITPAIAREIYSISGLYNLTQSPTYAQDKAIVLLLWGEGYSPSDIQTFFAQDYPSGFPAPTVTPYPVDGAPAPSANAVNDPSNASRELTLDIEWSGSMAPGATLDAVYAPDGPAADDYSPTDASMIDALNLAVDQSSLSNVAAISMSFGSADGQDSTLTHGFETDFAVAAKEQITMFAATGDLGGDAQSGCTGGTEPEYPASSPQVVAVGGTSVALDRSVLGAIDGFSESAWDQSGGGFSAQFAAPSWQEVGSAAAPISANGHRGTPDVAATAGYNFLYFDGQDGAGGGTSFATPIWAGMVTEMDALHGSDLGFLTPQIYAIAANASSVGSPFHDITSGGNCLGPAGPGWDTATGWGSPDGVNLYEHLVASFVNLTVSALPSPVVPGGTVTITARLTNYTSGAPIGDVGVVVSLSSAGIAGPCSGTFGRSVPVSNEDGEVVASIALPLCYLGASAVATATVTGGGYYGSVAAAVSVNLLGLSPSLRSLAQYPNNVVFYLVLMTVAIAVGGVLGRRSRPPPVRPSVVPAATGAVAPAASVPGPPGPSGSAPVGGPAAESPPSTGGSSPAAPPDGTA